MLYYIKIKANMKNKIKSNYFKRTYAIWIIFFISCYCIVACNFNYLKINAMFFQDDIDFWNKINDILKNLSYSYIAGTIFFFLSETIPYIEKQKSIIKNIERTINSILSTINQFSLDLHHETWGPATEDTDVFEKILGIPYLEENQDKEIFIKEFQQPCFKELYINLHSKLSFIQIQERYISQKLVKDIEKLQSKEAFFKIEAIADSQLKYISAKDFLDIIKFIMGIQRTLKKYL